MPNNLHVDLLLNNVLSTIETDYPETFELLVEHMRSGEDIPEDEIDTESFPYQNSIVDKLLRGGYGINSSSEERLRQQHGETFEDFELTIEAAATDHEELFAELIELVAKGQGPAATLAYNARFQGGPFNWQSFLPLNEKYAALLDYKFVYRRKDGTLGLHVLGGNVLVNWIALRKRANKQAPQQ